ncbi:MAG: hypothetical protein AAGC95_02770 [Pseudomonadota bacterium]
MMTMGQMLALWIAILVVCTSIGYIWQAANWFTENVLFHQIDNYDILAFAPYVLCVVIGFIVLYSARMGLSSSIALAVLWLLSKSPVF